MSPSLLTGFGIQAELTINLPGVSADEASTLVDKAHIVCPYLNVTCGKIDVSLVIVG